MSSALSSALSSVLKDWGVPAVLLAACAVAASVPRERVDLEAIEAEASRPCPRHTWCERRRFPVADDDPAPADLRVESRVDAAGRDG
jgi:hypothetical protein